MIDNIFYEDDWSQIYSGSCINILKGLPDNSVQCVVTSPPYWGLRDYQVNGQIGLERTPDEYVANMVSVFREVRRVLRKDGTLWLNLGDSYVGGATKGENEGAKQRTNKGATWGNNSDLALLKHKVKGLKQKDLVGIPWRVAFALQADGWYLRSDIIWHKPNPMPESVTDRPTKSHEYIFLMVKSARYYYDADAIREVAAYDGRKDIWQDGVALRNRRSVWTVATHPYKGAHFATFPPALIEPCILAGSRVGDTILDPFNGSGTTMSVAKKFGRKSIGIDINQDYCMLAICRIQETINN